jgi:hypothetical protein
MRHLYPRNYIVVLENRERERRRFHLAVASATTARNSFAGCNLWLFSGHPLVPDITTANDLSLTCGMFATSQSVCTASSVAGRIRLCFAREMRVRNSFSLTPGDHSYRDSQFYESACRPSRSSNISIGLTVVVCCTRFFIYQLMIRVTCSSRPAPDGLALGTMLSHPGAQALFRLRKKRQEKVDSHSSKSAGREDDSTRNMPSAESVTVRQ